MFKQFASLCKIWGGLELPLNVKIFQKNSTSDIFSQSILNVWLQEVSKKFFKSHPSVHSFKQDRPPTPERSTATFLCLRNSNKQ